MNPKEEFLFIIFSKPINRIFQKLLIFFSISLFIEGFTIIFLMIFIGEKRELGKTMIKTDGAGLAAPQIGKSIRLAVINSKDGPICLINPKITRKSWARELGQEGCLSIPGIFGQVKRHKKITVAYYNQAGKKIKQVAQGLMARVMQHEIDHLDGILFIDKMAGKKIKQHE